MNRETENRKKGQEGIPKEDRCETVLLYPGMELFYLNSSGDSFSLPHKPLAHGIRIDHCRAGQMNREAENGGAVSLNPGSFSVCAGKACADSALTFPAGQYRGLSILIDLQEMSSRPPDPLKDTDIFYSVQWKRLSRTGTTLFPAGSARAESIFSALYDCPGRFRLAHRRLKVLELLLYLADAGCTCEQQPTALSAEQLATVRDIHDHLLLHMERRTTIEELSRQYLINPTTLKADFKSVYGTSIAAHVKEHRMEQAACLLKSSNMSIAEIAQAVGYDSQSKFTVAFKSFFQSLPRDYRKKT
ncbi:MAG TPA: AraC family transcriptional regulator [Lachnospiraceae bacterium]|nr:AraC family transcriptional regulator [Lachnospiraceae bacterium]